MLQTRGLLRSVLLLLLHATLLPTTDRHPEIVLLAMSPHRRRDATEHIWRELSDRLRRFVRSRVDSPADVDDVLQSVFLSIHTKLDDLRETDRLESWVFQIARNAVADHFRKRRAAEGDAESLIAEPGDASLATVRREIAGCLSVLIDRLPDDQRRALSLYELDGISQKDIATRESISVSGAKSRIQRGRKTLEAMLKACCEFERDRRGNVMEYRPNDPTCCDESCG